MTRQGNSMIATHRRGGLPLMHSALTDHALSLIARGALPLRPYASVEAGFGNNEPCRLCTRPIDPTQARYRVPDPERLESESMTFHVHCYIAWESAASGL